MTDQITVPRTTWDALREALESVGKALPLGQSTVKTCYAINNIHRDAVHAALTAANAVSDLSLTNEGDMLAKQPEILAQYSGFNGHRQWATGSAWLYPGDAIAVISDHFRGVTKMVQPLGWYCVSRDGLVTQCADQRDAEMTAKSGDRDWPGSAPYRAVQLCEFEAPPQATEPAWRPIETAPKDGSDILLGHPDGSMVVGWWRENGLHGRASGWSDGDNFAMTWPSHWMPLPAAPEEKQ